MLNLVLDELFDVILLWMNYLTFDDVRAELFDVFKINRLQLNNVAFIFYDI